MIDSNVLVAAATVDHQHHTASFALMESRHADGAVTLVHCLSEFFNSATLPTRIGGSAMTPGTAARALATLTGALEVIALTIDQHVAAIEAFASRGGAGPQIYDFLIGHVAVIYDIPAIVTWNVRHFAPLFPMLSVLTPAEFLKADAS